MKNITVIFEVSDGLTKEVLHEVLCLAILEGAVIDDRVGNLVADIRLEGDEVPSG